MLVLAAGVLDADAGRRRPAFGGGRPDRTDWPGGRGWTSTLVEPVLKTAAISILTKVTGRCAGPPGRGGAAAFVEVAGTILALAAALPLAEGVLTMMAELLG
ncbi:MAG: hypothetical protein ACLR0P_06025 [Oscillospiraceae bacterium]